MDPNRLSINVITTQESSLDLIDSISDKEQRRQLIEQLLEASKQKKPQLQIDVVVKPSYTMSEILNRAKQEKPLSIQDLRTKINTQKIEVVLLKRIEILELGNNRKKLEQEDLENLEDHF